MNIKIKGIEIRNENPFVLIAGPCAIENERIVFETAEKIKEITTRLNIPYIFKASYDKANRTSINSYRGPGIKKGLEILSNVKEKYDLLVTTDIHLPSQAKQVSEVVDLLQIPAFLCRQTDLIVAAAETGKPINIKKAQFLAPWDMINVINKSVESGNDKVMVTERGTSFGYNNLVVDMTSLIEMKKFDHPVIFDATHSVQKPGGKGNTTGGNREYVEYLAKAALSIGIGAIFMEVHPNPEEALSDGPNMVKLSDLERILKDLKEIDRLIKKY
jgi:2-dehydro-3-deoxyphosphooctonate aldolase (KDO 8-P synthase)